MKTRYDELFQLPERRSWPAWLRVIVVWFTLLLSPFALIGETWGMIWYIAMWPTSQVLEDLHESLGVTSYILLVSLGQTAFLMPYVIIICNAARMLRRNKTDASPPTAVAS